MRFYWNGSTKWAKSIDAFRIHAYMREANKENEKTFVVIEWLTPSSENERSTYTGVIRFSAAAIAAMVGYKFSCRGREGVRSWFYT